MATYFSPSRVIEVTVYVKVNLANGGEHVREMVFTDEENGRETVIQLADLLLSACDLADSKLTHKAPLTIERKEGR